MGAWAYCHHQPKGEDRCWEPMSRPTVAQVLGRDEWTCSQGHKNDVTQENIDDIVIDLDERLRALEEGLKVLL